MRNIGNNNPVDIYREYGDRRPPTERLYDIFERTNDLVGEDLDMLCVMGDICIDLAVNQPDDNNDWLLTAKETLDEAHDTALDMYSHGYKVNLGTAVKALLRNFELSRWQAAIDGKDLATPDYLNMLDLAEKVVPLTKQVALDTRNLDLACSSFREFTPLLLGARATALGLGGWQGRLSLEREDRRPLTTPRFNYNWDTGVMRTTKAEEFMFPGSRLQIKTEGSRSHPADYGRAGIKVIRATEYGFYDFATIVQQASTEVEALTTGQPFGPITQQLNSLTGKLRQAINEPLRH